VCKIFFTRGRNMFWILICASGIWYHLPLQVSREWKPGCNKNVTVSGSCKGDLLTAPWLKAVWWLLSSLSDQHTVGGISSLGKIYFFHFLWNTWWHDFCGFNGNQRVHSASTALIHLFSFVYCFSPVYRIFGHLNFVTDLEVLRGSVSKYRIRFCPSGQDKPLQTVLQFEVKHWKTSQKVSKVNSNHF